MNTDKHRCKNGHGKGRIYPRFLILSVSICVYLWLIFLTSCTTKPTDMRTLVPAETLVYLETNDLAAALQPIVDAKPFKEVAKTKPDFSALKGVQLAVAVTGFETSEEKLTDEHSVGRVQPHFVAVADTHVWNYQAVAFAEKKLGGFVADIYDSEPTLERSDKHGGKYFMWAAKDGRKAYALVIDSIIYFGNDESAIDKCLAVKRGESDSVAKAGKVKSADPATLASGYVSTDGVAQIANIVGLKFATEAGEDSEVQSAIAGILPQLIRNSVTDIKWIATKTEQGIEDRYQIGMPTEIASVFSETMVTGDGCNASSFKWLPADVPIATCYNFRNAQVAWRSVVLVAQKRTDAFAGKVIAEFSHLLLEPYGIADPELFFSASNSGATTANFSPDGEKPILIAQFFDEKKIYSSLISELSKQTGDGVKTSADGDVATFGIGLTLFSGDSDTITSLYPFTRGVQNTKPMLAETIDRGFDRNSVSVTVGRDSNTTLFLVDMLAREGHGDTQAVSTYLTETRFTNSGMERKTTSDFGLIGAIIAQLGQD
ncbi:MAG TPA: hypothetical protein PLL77_09625 [Pyrinomonadaceae bacterium]|nr:hypothetical protein [Pyrinomonadaceae bacterium]